MRYAATGRRRDVSTRARSRFVAPVAKNARSSKSSEMLGSPASIFATRDWLDRSFFASAAWVTPCRIRRCFNAPLTAKRVSTRAASSADNSKNSAAPPTRQPAASTRFRFLASILVSSSYRVVQTKPAPAILNHARRRLLRPFLKDIRNNDRIVIKPIDNPPRLAGVHDSQLVAPSPDRPHRPRVRHSQPFAPLQPPQQHAGLNPRFCGERRCLLTSPRSQTSGLSL
jgi:hypothetical protein